MDLSQEREDDHGPQKRQQHIPMRVPYVSLGTQIGLAHIGSDEKRHPPFQEFPEGGNGQYDTDHNKIEPPAPLQRGSAQKDLTDNEGRKDPQGHMTEAIEMIPAQIKDLFGPVPQGGAA